MNIDTTEANIQPTDTAIESNELDFENGVILAQANTNGSLQITD
jgi:hypothetical protein